ncbi:cytochrome P450 [Neofusicoccum parvum]|uniref:Cytochrome P450 n=1 Tax=Neofusicoccum parvum TaxID=310453 RepID=A0ACB5RZZ2_9PEZI|nr:cytochrome P450 [Neofusicoccum parvum]
MPSTLVALAIAAALTAALHHLVVHPLLLSPLARIPGPKLYALTRWRLALEDWTGRRTRTVHALHEQYGPVVRIGPNEVHFNSLSALRTIYGAGSGFERTSFYRMFDVYGKQNLFTFHTVAAHAARKKLLAHAYSKTAVVRGPVAAMVESKIADFLSLVASQTPGSATEIFSTLHYYSLDAITAFLYGSPAFGATAALRGTPAHRRLLDDILDPARRRLTWFAVHFPAFTRWLYSRTALAGRLVAPLLPMRKPSTYTGIRAHALAAMRAFAAADAPARQPADGAILARLWKRAGEPGALGELDVASECADHLLAGIDTTSDTIMFALWALSRPENAAAQARLVAECRSLPAGAEGVVEAADGPGMVWLDAVVRETLRLFAPLPASEPRSCPRDAVVDGWELPRGTVCAMAPYSLHRNAAVFEDPGRWDPERWIRGGGERVAEMRKWWWPFSSGGRMCIGMHLAMAEMALVPAIYKKYSTRIKPGFESVSPGITSRFEVFGDDTFPKMEVSDGSESS